MARSRRGYSRNQRVAELIQTTLAEILQRDALGLQLGIVTVTGATVAHDLSHAKIFVSVFDETLSKDVLAKLNAAAKTLRYELAHSIKLRVTPELKFIYDDSALRGTHITSLINRALKDDDSSSHDH